MDSCKLQVTSDFKRIVPSHLRSFKMTTNSLFYFFKSLKFLLLLLLFGTLRTHNNLTKKKEDRSIINVLKLSSSPYIFIEPTYILFGTQIDEPNF